MNIIIFIVCKSLILSFPEHRKLSMDSNPLHKKTHRNKKELIYTKLRQKVSEPSK